MTENLSPRQKAREFGIFAERRAEDHLVAQGYAIRERNWRLGNAEIDLIAERGKEIAFIEVKARSTNVGDPMEAMTPAKISKIVRGADAYLRSLPYDFQYRFDIILVTGCQEAYTIEHIEDAFFPSAL